MPDLHDIATYFSHSRPMSWSSTAGLYLHSREFHVLAGDITVSLSSLGHQVSSAVQYSRG